MKLSGLIDAVAETLGEPVGTVRLKARKLRESGLIASGGRGRGGAEMTSRDLAHLLLAILVPGETTAAAEGVGAIAAAKPRSLFCGWGLDEWTAARNPRGWRIFSRKCLIGEDVNNKEAQRLVPPPLKRLELNHGPADALELLFKQLESGRYFPSVLKLSTSSASWTVDIALDTYGRPPFHSDEGGAGAGRLRWNIGYFSWADNDSHVSKSADISGDLIIEVVEKSLNLVAPDDVSYADGNPLADEEA